MPRSYGLECPVARTLDIIGERWTLLLLRDLFLHGPRRYHDFEQSFPDISPNTLSDRLKKLESENIVSREVYQERPMRTKFVLTEKGRALGPVLREIRRWGTAQGWSAP